VAEGAGPLTPRQPVALPGNVQVPIPARRWCSGKR
jgi:hypothetical protein